MPYKVQARVELFAGINNTLAYSIRSYIKELIRFTSLGSEFLNRFHDFWLKKIWPIDILQTRIFANRLLVKRYLVNRHFVNRHFVTIHFVTRHFVNS
jgi:hypothetical protein